MTSGFSLIIILTVVAIAVGIGAAVAMGRLRNSQRASLALPLLKFLTYDAVVALVCLALLALVTQIDAGTVFGPILWLFVFDTFFLGAFMLALVPLAIWKQAAFAVLKRNFLGYFANPTGYVFLCLFVLLTSFAAFWPHEFFNANLPNLEQLNAFFPFIMLVFIPAITMGVWADERRQGTDELLLTIPAGDFDIVLGKYLAAASIFTASLLFAQVSTYTVLVSLSLGDVDVGLLIATYFGYWMVGLAMLAVGMVASFLTNILTVGFILGVAFNAPLVFAQWADTIAPTATLTQVISSWSIGGQFEDFGRGVISLSSVTYFVMVIAVGLYLCMLLIGRRHWIGGRDGDSMLVHYLARTVCLVVIALAANVVFARNDLVRVDMTDGAVSSLSPETRRLIANLEPEHPVVIEAFISEEVPEDFVKTKLDLLSLLREFKSLAGAKIKVQIHNNLNPSSEEAAMAAERYGIEPRTVRGRSRGQFRDQEVILGAAFVSGLEKVVAPFFEFGVPVEYELVRSIATVAEGKRKTLGVLQTDARLTGGFVMSGMSPQNTPKQAIITELEKQYDVEQVDPNSPIDVTKYDALLAAQPSSLTPTQMENFLAAVKAGLPTAIFEDPIPLNMANAPGTSQPKQAAGGMFGGNQPEPKGEIQDLWDALGVRMLGNHRPGQTNVEVVWQQYNPYPKLQLQGIVPEFVFIRPEAPSEEENFQPFNPNSPITSGLEEVLFMFPGGLEQTEDAPDDLEYTELVTTGSLAGAMSYQQYMGQAFFGPAQLDLNPARLDALRKMSFTGQNYYTLAARIQGKAEESEDDAASDESDEAAADRPIDVVYVADVDVLDDQFLFLRARPDEEIRFNFENVTFVLNVIDALAGEKDFLEIRKRKPHHGSLRLVEMRVDDAREDEIRAQQEYRKQFDEALGEAREEMQKTIDDFNKLVADLEKRYQEGEDVFAELEAAKERLAIQSKSAEDRFAKKEEQLERERDRRLKNIRREVDLDIRKIQTGYKLWAVVLPPIPPLLVGLVVFVRRRLREREGIARSRLK
ncbi:MAG: Gldg family protein [Planctomycetes bacterium]|nr:Gldg family protein [Planctomycetota bacterium]